MQVKIFNNMQNAASIDADPKFLNISPNLRFNNTYLFFAVLIFSICLFFIHVPVFLDDGNTARDTCPQETRLVIAVGLGG